MLLADIDSNFYRCHPTSRGIPSVSASLYVKTCKGYVNEFHSGYVEDFEVQIVKTKKEKKTPPLQDMFWDDT